MTAQLVTLKDGRSVKLGRIRPKVRPQVLNFGNYFNAAAANLPASVDWSAKAMASINRVFLND